jgi:hypothetical protein
MTTKLNSKIMNIKVSINPLVFFLMARCFKSDGQAQNDPAA